MKPLLKKVESPSLMKLAYSIRLGKDADDWPVEILQEAYKQAPYLKSYEVDVEIDRTDESRGFGVGKMVVYPSRMEKSAAIKSDRIVSFPLIIRQHEMAPLDVISHKNEMVPATEDFVSEKLFRPEMFERSGRMGEFKGTDITSQIDPPTNRRQSGLTKSSSVSLWKAVLPTIKQDDADAFKSELKRDPSLRVAAVSNPVLSDIVEDLLTYKEKSASEYDDERREKMAPTVVQFQKKGRRYFVKTANHNIFNPVVKEISRFEAQDYLSREEFSKLAASGHVTYTVGVKNTQPAITKIASEEVTRYGEYEVLHGAKSIAGTIIPNVMDFEGNNLYQQIFVGQGVNSMQEKVAGVYVGNSNLTSSEVRGPGVFTYRDRGMAVATEPVTVLNRIVLGKGKEKIAFYKAKRGSTGQALAIYTDQDIQKVAFDSSTGNVFLPKGMEFISLRGDSVKLCGSIDTYNETKMAKTASELEFVGDGVGFQIRGNTPFADLMNKEDASFALSAHGLSASQIERVFQKTASGSVCRLPNTRPVIPEDDAKSFASTVLDRALPNVSNLRVDLTKEASVLVEKETVDSILSLRFLTPENVGVYVNYLPELEKVSSKLAEILVASRLGMDDVKEVAAKNALSQLSTVIGGLSELKSKTQ